MLDRRGFLKLLPAFSLFGFIKPAASPTYYSYIIPFEDIPIGPIYLDWDLKMEFDPNQLDINPTLEDVY